jgi:3-methyladenine DNA glycosylase AlkD
MADMIDQIRKILHQNADETIRLSSRRFFKEEVTVYGIKTTLVTSISKEFFAGIRNLPKNEIFAICEKLWQSGYMEESFIACNWSHSLRKQYEISDFALFEKWVDQYVSNWASCDTLCNHTIGSLVEMYPELFQKLKVWALSPNRWVKRASAVSLIVPARKGKFLPDIFDIADILLTDKDDMVQKGYGWMLKVASQAHLKEVFDYVMRNKAIMPRTALRYAIEKMPNDMKTQAMAR